MRDSQATLQPASGAAPAQGRLPDFILIGSMKSGTTTLQRHLAAHPGVFMCTPKEPQFFSRDEAFAKGLDWYRGLFAAAAEHQLCGEASTCYTRWPGFDGVPQRIQAQLHEVKLVYQMRHPVERAYSHYRHLMQERELSGGGRILSFEEALEEIEEITTSSLYLRQIERYLAVFERERLHCLTLDELEAGPAATLDALFDFLGLEPSSQTSRAPLVANRTGSRISYRKTDRLLARLRRTKGLSALIDLLPRNLRSNVRRWIVESPIASLATRRSQRRHRSRVSGLSPETRAELVLRFRAPTLELQEFLGRDLGAWLE